MTIALNAWYKCDDAAAQKVVADASGNGLNGAAYANIVSVAGVNGTAIDFDGAADRVSLGKPAWVTQTKGSVALWAKVAAWGNGKWLLGIGRDDSNQLFGLKIYKPSGTAYLQIFQRNLPGQATDDVQHVTDVALPVDAWVHIVLTSDGSAWKVYINGTNCTTFVSDGGGNNGNWFGDCTSNANSLVTFGAVFFANAYTAFSDCSIDDVRIYDDELLQAQVDAIYNEGDGSTAAYPWIVPAVTGVDATDGTYEEDDVLAVTVTFDNAVTVTGTPQLTLHMLSGDVTANYYSGSGTTALVFRYTVQEGDKAFDLDYSATDSLALNGGTIKLTADLTTNATLTLPAPGGAGSLSDNAAVVVATTNPYVAAATAYYHPRQFAKTMIDSCVSVVQASEAGAGDTNKMQWSAADTDAKATVDYDDAEGRVGKIRLTWAGAATGNDYIRLKKVLAAPLNLTGKHIGVKFWMKQGTLDAADDYKWINSIYCLVSTAGHTTDYHAWMLWFNPASDTTAYPNYEATPGWHTVYLTPRDTWNPNAGTAWTSGATDLANINEVQIIFQLRSAPTSNSKMCSITLDEMFTINAPAQGNAIFLCEAGYTDVTAAAAYAESRGVRLNVAVDPYREQDAAYLSWEEIAALKNSSHFVYMYPAGKSLEAGGQIAPWARDQSQYAGAEAATTISDKLEAIYFNRTQRTANGVAEPLGDVVMTIPSVGWGINDREYLEDDEIFLAPSNFGHTVCMNNRSQADFNNRFFGFSCQGKDEAGEARAIAAINNARQDRSLFVRLQHMNAEGDYDKFVAELDACLAPAGTECSGVTMLGPPLKVITIKQGLMGELGDGGGILDIGGDGLGMMIIGD